MTGKRPILTSIVFGLIIFLFSYTFIDPNLIFFAKTPILVKFQHFLFFWGNNYSFLNGLIFSFILIFWYPWFKSSLQLQFKTVITIAIIISIFGFLSYPVFSHDLFNYIFNAKILTIYHQSPTKVTLFDFINQDNWVRFMHNTKAASPYGPAWRYISAASFYLFYKIRPSFLSAFVALKLVNLISYWTGSYFIFLILKFLKIKNIKSRLAFFLLNPVILWEGLYMAHNDMLMTTFGLASFYFLIKAGQDKNLKSKLINLFLTAFFLSLSITTKYATLVLIPLYILYLIKSKLNITLYVSFILFLTAFSRWPWLHSWYFIWPISFAVLINNLKIVRFFWVLSFFLIIRYLPFITQQSWSLNHYREIILLLGIPIAILINNKMTSKSQ